jgi:hypothetical protein
VIGDWKLEIGDWRLMIEDCNLQSKHGFSRMTARSGAGKICNYEQLIADFRFWIEEEAAWKKKF